jgi:general secretion pathway protein D
MGVITGRNIVVDPRVKGTINLNTEKPVTPAAAYNQFLAALRLQGYTVVEAGGIYKVVPEADAKLQGGAVQTGPVGPGGNQIVTQIFRLNYEKANNLVPVLRPLISPNNTINVNPGNNSLVITDYADNLQRMGRIIARWTCPMPPTSKSCRSSMPSRPTWRPMVHRLIESAAAAAARRPRPGRHLVQAPPWLPSRAATP